MRKFNLVELNGMRKVKDFSLTDLSLMAGCSKSHLSRVIRGERVLSDDLKGKLARIYHQLGIFQVAERGFSEVFKNAQVSPMGIVARQASKSEGQTPRRRARKGGERNGEEKSINLERSEKDS